MPAWEDELYEYITGIIFAGIPAKYALWGRIFNHQIIIQ